MRVQRWQQSGRQRALLSIVSHAQCGSPRVIWEQCERDHGLDWNTLTAFCHGVRGYQYDQEWFDAAAYARTVAGLLPSARWRHDGEVSAEQLKLAAYQPLFRREQRIGDESIWASDLFSIITGVKYGNFDCLTDERTEEFAKAVDRLGQTKMHQAQELRIRGHTTSSCRDLAELYRSEFNLFALTAASRGNVSRLLAWLMSAERLDGVESAAQFVVEVFNDYPEELR